MKIGALISGGKDSLYAAYEVSKKNEIACIIAIKAKNPESYMFHIPNIELVKEQAKLMNKPIIFEETEGKKEEELKDLKKAIKKAITEYKIEAIVTGAIKSSYQKTRIDNICKELKIKSLAPLWQINEQEYLDKLKNWEIIIVGIAADGLNKEMLGKKLNTELIKKFPSYVSFIGEGGEFETLVTNCPLFKQKIKILKAETKMENSYTGTLKIKKIILENKSP